MNHPDWFPIAERLIETLSDLCGYDVLIVHAVECELERAYKLGIEKGKELAGEHQQLRGKVSEQFATACSIWVTCDGGRSQIWGAENNKVHTSGKHLRAIFKVHPDDDLWMSGAVVPGDDSYLVPETDTYFFLDNGAEFYTAGKQINGN